MQINDISARVCETERERKREGGETIIALLIRKDTAVLWEYFKVLLQYSCRLKWAQCLMFANLLMLLALRHSCFSFLPPAPLRKAWKTMESKARNPIRVFGCCQRERRKPPNTQNSSLCKMWFRLPSQMFSRKFFSFLHSEVCTCCPLMVPRICSLLALIPAPDWCGSLLYRCSDTKLTQASTMRSVVPFVRSAICPKRVEISTALHMQASGQFVFCAAGRSVVG